MGSRRYNSDPLKATGVDRRVQVPVPRRVTSRSSDRQALDALATAMLLALDAHRVLIAVRAGDGWTVRGGALAAPEEGSSPPTRLRGGCDLTPRALHASAVAVLEDGDWQLAPTPAPPADCLVMSHHDEHPPAVLLVAQAAGCADVEQRMRALLDAAVDAVTVEEKVDRDRLQESLTEREEERRRWARELHDETLQELGALQLLLTSVRQDRAAGGQPPQVLRAALDQAAELVSNQIVSLRYLINELRPTALDELGLRPPLEALAERTERSTGMQVQMQVSLPYADGRVSTRLLPDVELAVYRVVQEALTNAARHSGGDRAWVVVAEESGQVRVEVTDNGKGVRHAPGFGIDGMRERATLAGGRLEVVPGALPAEGGAGGTTVRLVVPALHRQESDPSASAASGEEAPHL